jgi:hypothetical protein
MTDTIAYRNRMRWRVRRFIAALPDPEDHPVFRVLGSRRPPSRRSGPMLVQPRSCSRTAILRGAAAPGRP